MRAAQSTGSTLMLSMLLLTACRAEPVANEAAKNLSSADALAAAPANLAEPPADPPAAPQNARYRFTGTEPFWGGTIEGANILYQTPDDQEGKTITTTMTKEGPTLRFSGELGGQPFVLKLTPGTCSDGMSDTVYPLHAVLAVRGEPRQGCAKPIVGASASSQIPPAARAP